ncbi:hypothetical protein AB0J80_22640 [Actinoplanes sp. NPDC049548]|uniref:hypothetical protein n=1 Tax=Actinoplanes sp. NPDC049548 TaxID=3155152 RepID=UPI003447B4B2
MVFTESAGQIAGQLGQVVGLTDPAESDEWVVVRFGRDELPFAPGDLQVAPRGAAARKVAAPPPAAPPPRRPEPEFVIDKPVGSLRGGGGAAVAVESGSGKANGKRSGGDSGGSEAGSPHGGGFSGGGSARGDRRAGGTGVSSDGSEGGSGVMSDAGDGKSGRAATGGNGRTGVGAAVSASSGAPAPTPRKASSRAAKPKPPPGLTVTLAYTDGEWTIAANQGSKALAKPYVVRPAEAMRMVALVDVPGVQEAVEQIVAAERAEAEQQAERLRAELAEIEARLQELREAG